MEQPPRDIEQAIARLMATDLNEQEHVGDRFDQLDEQILDVLNNLQQWNTDLRQYFNDLRIVHNDLRRREEELRRREEALEEQPEEQTDFTEEEIGAGRCYFRVLKKFEKYANKPYKNIWTRYDKLRNILKCIAEDEDLPRLSRSRAETLLDDMERKICRSIEDVIAYTKHIFIQCLLIAGNHPAFDVLKDLKTAAIDLKDKVNDEINN